MRTKLIPDGEWIKGEDWLDGSPRYTLTIPGEVEALMPRYCDSPTSAFRWHVCVVTEREREYRGGPMRRYYYAHVTDCHKESAWESNRFTNAKDARLWAEKTYLKAIEEETW